jgi:predicted XRE-type DNA-binding protein
MKEVRWHGSSRSDVEAFPNDARREAGYQLFQVQIGENPSDWKPMPSVGAGVREIRIRQASGVRRLPDHLPNHDRRRCSRVACVPEENTGNGQTGHRPRQSTVQTVQVTIMARSVFHDLFLEEEAAELEMRAKLLSGINKWLSKSGLTQTEAAEQLGVTQARVSEIKNGKINRFSLSMLVRLAQRAGLRPGIKLQKAA